MTPWSLGLTLRRRRAASTRTAAATLPWLRLLGRGRTTAAGSGDLPAASRCGQHAPGRTSRSRVRDNADRPRPFSEGVAGSRGKVALGPRNRAAPACSWRGGGPPSGRGEEQSNAGSRFEVAADGDQIGMDEPVRRARCDIADASQRDNGSGLRAM